MVVVVVVFVVFVVVFVFVVAIAGGGKGEDFAIFVQMDRLETTKIRKIFRESNKVRVCMCKVIVYRSVITIIFSSCF